MVPEAQFAEYQNELADEQGSFLRALPGGKRATPDEVVVAIFVAAALVFLIAVRRGFRPVLISP